LLRIYNTTTTKRLGPSFELFWTTNVSGTSMILSSLECDQHQGASRHHLG
jgi:hypothetical protein